MLFTVTVQVLVATVFLDLNVNTHYLLLKFPAKWVPVTVIVW